MTTATEVLADRCVWYGSMPVAWVACWSDTNLRVVSIDSTPTGLIALDNLDRSERIGGQLFMGNSTTIETTGVPDFGATNSWKQRQSMMLGLCQVCGRPPTEYVGPPLWTIPNETAMIDGFVRDGISINPPVCGSCLVAAEVFCPHLSAGGVPAFTARKVSIVAVAGDHVDPTTGRTDPNVLLPLGDPERAWQLGRQFIVKLDDADPVEWATLRRLFPVSGR